MSGPSQPKVIGEDWSDERVRNFLNLKPYGDIHVDYHVLREAYEYMLAKDYKRFVKYFVDEGRDVNAVGPDGTTMLARISRHGRSQEYAEILREAGAVE